MQSSWDSRPFQHPLDPIKVFSPSRVSSGRLPKIHRILFEANQGPVIKTSVARGSNFLKSSSQGTRPLGFKIVAALAEPKSTTLDGYDIANRLETKRMPATVIGASAHEGKSTRRGFTISLTHFRREKR